MSTDFFADIDRIAFEGPDSDNPLAFRWYDADRVVAGKTMADQLRFAVSYWHSFNSEGIDIFGAGTLDRPWLDPARDPMDAAKEKMAVAFEFVSKARRAVLLLPRPRHRPRRVDVRRVVPQLRRDGRPRRRAPGAHRREAAVGHRQPLLAPPVHGRRRDQPRSRPLPLRGRTGGALHERDASTRRRQLRAVGWPRGLRDAAQHRHEARTRPTRPVHEPRRRAQARHRIRRAHPDRAEAVRADEAPVRLRRCHGLRVPAEVRTGERDQGQHRGQPRDAGRPRLPSRGRCGVRTPASSVRSTPTPATTGSAGTSTGSPSRSSR